MPQSVGDYILERNLGSGSSGKVKLARNKITGQLFAIKIIKKSKFKNSPNLLQKVHREITLMRLLNHPNILPFVDVLESENHLFIVEGYAQNGSLLDVIPNIKLEAAMNYFRQIIYGLDYLHLYGICHRDLKPENLLLDFANQLWIADFGFACWMPDNVANTSCGSPLYAAPEVIRGLPYDGKKVDIWSAGVILYTMIHGKLPFVGFSVRQAVQKIKKGDFSISPSVEPIVQDLIKKILVVDVKKRYTIEQIKAHPAFKIGLPDGYILPKPLPLPVLSKPISLSLEDEPLLYCLQKVGFEDMEKLKSLLLNDKPNMAKVFYFMLRQQQEIIWDDQSEENYSENSFHVISSPIEPIFGQSDIPSTPSFCESFENAQVWLDDDSAFQNQRTNNTYLLEHLCININGLMFIIQSYLTRESYKFLFPNDRMLIAKNDSINIYANFVAEYETPDFLLLKIQLIEGTFESFQSLTRSIHHLLMDFVQMQDIDMFFSDTN